MTNLLKTLISMNSNFGRGTVRGISFDDDCINGAVVRRVPITQRTYFTETRRFRRVGNRVHFAGHSRKVQ